MTEPVKPDYSGAWIGGIVPALLDGADASWLPACVAGAGGVVLLVVDGMGAALLDRHRDALPVLSSLQGGAITATIPSTTAAGLTSISTGAAPSEHGLAGYRIRVGGEWLNVLTWPEKGPDPEKVQPLVPFAGREVPVVTRSEFRHSGFTVAHLRNTELVGWKLPSTLVQHVGRLTRRHRFVYAYYDGFDKVAHEYGLRSGFARAELSAVDRLAGDLLCALPPDWALVVTADHGHVHVDAEGVVRLDAVEGMVSAYGGEGRFRNLVARPGATHDLLQACEDAYGEQAWVFARERLVEEGWLGPPTLAVRSRLGDVVLAARAPVMFLDPNLSREGRMLAHHGSMTAEEVRVPLLGGRGRAGQG